MFRDLVQAYDAGDHVVEHYQELGRVLALAPELAQHAADEQAYQRRLAKLGDVEPAQLVQLVQLATATRRSSSGRARSGRGRSR